MALKVQKTKGKSWLGAQVGQQETVMDSFKIIAAQKDFAEWNHWAEQDKLRRLTGKTVN